jgi:hypothetical protein
VRQREDHWLSVDPVDNHAKRASDIEETQGHAPNYPLIGDADFTVSKLCGMLPADVSGDPTQRERASAPASVPRLLRTTRERTRSGSTHSCIWGRPALS